MMVKKKRFLLTLLLIGLLVLLTGCFTKDKGNGDEKIVTPPITKYTVIFNSNGGTEVTTLVSVTSGSLIVAPISTKTGYSLGGWYKNYELTMRWNFDVDTVREHITLFAKWEPNICFVRFETNGGSLVPSVYKPYDLLLTEPVKPTKKGCYFRGWYKDSDLTKYWDFETDRVKGNITLYAKWEENSNSYFEINKIEGGCAIINYTGSDLSIVIPKSLEYVSVISIGGSAFKGKNIYNVIIPDSVISIGGYAFNKNSLDEVNIPDSVTSIGEYAFAQNSFLSSVNIGNSVTSIGKQAFYYNHIKEIDIPDSVTYLSGFDHNFLEYIDIPTSVTTIGEDAFYENQLTSVTIPNSVTTIEASAFGSNKLTNVTIPNSVTSIGKYAFGANLLTSVTIPNSITRIEGWAFSWNQLTKVTIPISVTSIGESAFEENKLSSVTIPNSVTKIEKKAFYNNLLETITIPASVTDIGEYAFGNNPLLEEIRGKAGSAAETYAKDNEIPFIAE